MPLLAQAFFSASNQTQTVYTPAAGKISTVNVNVCNMGTDTITISLGLCPAVASVIPLANYIEFQTPLSSYGGTLERTALTMSPTQAIIASMVTTGSNSAASMSIVVWGFEL